MPAGNDFVNNSILNPVIHPTDDDDGRGVPAIGKQVYDTRVSGPSWCIDTSPNADQNGGGTWITFSGEWTTFTPTLIAATTDPTLGSGSTQLGRYTQIGSTIICRIFIQFGTSGVNAGNGIYYIGDLPLPFTLINTACGHGHIYDDSSNTYRLVSLTRPGKTGNHSVKLIAEGNSQVSNTAPWTWAANDFLNVVLEYEALL
jgi:hypothetical protein